MRVPSLGQEGPLEEEIATHSSILAWKIPWREEFSGRLQSMELQRVGHGYAHTHTHTHLNFKKIVLGNLDSYSTTHSLVFQSLLWKRDLVEDWPPW